MKKIFNIQNIVICLCVFMMFAILSFNYENYLFQMFLVILLSLYVIFFYFGKKYIFPKYSTLKKYCIFITSLLIYTFVLCVAFDFYNDRPIYIAKTSDVNKAKEIGKMSKYTNVSLDVSTNMYYIRYNIPHSSNDFSIAIAKRYVNDDNIEILHSYYYLWGFTKPSNKSLANYQQKYYTKLLKKIPGVSSVNVKVSITDKETNVVADIEYDGYTEKEINAIIVKLIDKDSIKTINLKEVNE